MSENRETENLKSPRFGLNVLYHRDQAKLDREFYAAHATKACVVSTDSEISMMPGTKCLEFREGIGPPRQCPVLEDLVWKGNAIPYDQIG